MARGALRRQTTSNKPVMLAGVSAPSPEIEHRNQSIREAIEECDHQLDHYRALLDAGGAPGSVIAWIADTAHSTAAQLERSTSRRQAHAQSGPRAHRRHAQHHRRARWR